MEEKNSRLLSFLYGTPIGRKILKILTMPAVSKLAGRVMDSRLSALVVPGFIKANGIDTSEFEKNSFISYNDFFTRKLVEGARKNDTDENALISPCDAKLTVFPITEGARFSIKRGTYTVKSLLRDEKLAKRFEGGTLWQFRLSVDDYHRYQYPADGVRSAERSIKGIFHTVQPIALEHCRVYQENTRKYCLIKTAKFKTIVMMEVGAMMVGKIKNHHTQAKMVSRDEEKGYFEFGGSTIILLTQKSAAEPRSDISLHSMSGFETQVRRGEKITADK